MTAQRVVLGAWIAMIALASVRYAASNQKGLPPPSTYVGSAVLFTILYGASSFLGPLAAVLAVGVDIGAVATPYLQGRSSVLDQAASWLNTISGAPAGTGTVTA
jgi:hypothetical protein